MGFGEKITFHAALLFKFFCKQVHEQVVATCDDVRATYCRLSSLMSFFFRFWRVFLNLQKQPFL